jgi:hypothetical protein
MLSALGSSDIGLGKGLAITLYMMTKSVLSSQYTEHNASQVNVF